MVNACKSKRLIVITQLNMHWCLPTMKLSWATFRSIVFKTKKTKLTPLTRSEQVMKSATLHFLGSSHSRQKWGTAQALQIHSAHSLEQTTLCWTHQPSVNPGYQIIMLQKGRERKPKSKMNKDNIGQTKVCSQNNKERKVSHHKYLSCLYKV